MNQPIRCEPLPFLKTNGEAAAGARLCTEAGSESTSDFSHILNTELADVSSNPEAKAENPNGKEIDALATYGVAPLLVQLVPREALIEAQETQPITSPRLFGGEYQAEGVAPLEQPTNNATTQAATDSFGQAKPESGRARLEGLILPEHQPVIETAEQKLPSLPKEVAPVPEQISGKPPEAAKKSNGIAVAQPPLMLMTNQQEKNALQTGQPLVLQQFEAASFEQQIRLEPLTSRPFRGERSETFEPTAIETGLPQTPRFEALSNEIELQPVRPIEPVAIVEEIRTHIELLKSSTAEKLDVVVRPDAQTELKIQVEKVNGYIQVQVRCDRGDFAALETHWSAVQNTLATQGIRVEPLQQGGGAQLQQHSPQNSQNFSGQHSNHHEDRPAVFIEQEFTNREATRAKPARALARHGWQSWA